MKKSVSFCAALVAAFAVVACDGSGSGSAGGDSGGASAAQSTVAAAPVADLLFVNVPTDTRKTSVVPGERAEITAFRVEGINTPIEQLVFTNTAATTSALSALFKRVRLVSNTGDDVGAEAFYTVNFDDKKGTLTLDFSNQWVPVDSGSAPVPGTYSLIADVKTDVKLDTAFNLELTAAQTHAYGKKVSSEVKGGTFTVKSVAGINLPVVTTASPASSTTASELGGSPIEIGSFKVSCPEKNSVPCALETVSFRVCGMGNPMISSADGHSWWSGYGYSLEGYYAPTITNMEYAVPPGETKTLTVSATPYNAELRLNVVDMMWNMGGSTKVSPLISPTSVPGGLVETDTKECPDSGKG